MQIRSLWRRSARPAALCLRGTNRYERWAYATHVVEGPFPGSPLSEEDLGLATAWANSQRTWNLYMEVLCGPDDEPRVLAIAGAEGIHPEWIVYRSGDGYQTDESSESAWSPSLDDALCRIANMPAGLSMSLLSLARAECDALVLG